MSLYEVYAKTFRSPVQTAILTWRLRLRAAAAGSRARVYVRRSFPLDPWDPKPAYRRIKRGLRIRFDRGVRAHVFLGHQLEIEPDVSLRFRGGALYLGNWTRLGEGTSFDVSGTVLVRERCELGAGSLVVSRGGDVEIEPGVVLGPRAAVVGGAAGTRTVVGRWAHVGTGAAVVPEADVAARRDVPAMGVADERAVHATADPLPRGGRLVSVVVTTRDRREMLPRLLEALERQTLPPGRFEVVIVDDGSTDGTAELLEAWARATPLVTRLIRHERSLGTAAGRNAGWRAARSPIVAFTDDDCAPVPEWLEAGIRFFREEPELGIVQGETDPEPRSVGDLRGLNHSQRIEWEAGLYETCNVFYRRAAIEAAGGFGEGIAFAGEDAELAVKVKAAGYSSRFIREALVFHAVHRGRLRDLPRRFRRWSDIIAVVRRSPGMRRGFYRRIFWSKQHAWFLMALMGAAGAAGGAALGGGFWVWLAPLALCLPYVWFLLRASRETTSVPGRILYAPVRIVADAIEFGMLAAGSIRHRTVLL